ncbi:hypothetical protein [Sphingomonas oligoaromativorans]|uniref:hypothetical protein n=1 Tax=Sphingomonas oligoaromativorans TaxID=575322 RepID=UPI00142400C1|nr:hypothetical protein [Sphingomonas oligoaromativorans]NIJ33434.1 hypothetical protein [Sphingomonas oligoaromativorans]
MRVAAILALACLAGCHKAERSHAIAARAPASSPGARPGAPAAPPPARTYTLRGLLSDPQVFPDLKQCREALNINAAAMDIVANGSSAQLRCVPTQTDLATAVNNQGH